MTGSATVALGRRVALLRGGTSPEREISLLSATTVATALDDLGLDWVGIDPADEHWWQALHADDLVFNCLHGGDGEGGVIQGFLQTLGYAFTGSDMASSALAMNKLQCKRIWQAMGVATAPFQVLTESSDWSALVACWPISFVKPVRGGSSLGMTRVESAAELEEAWRAAREIDPVVIMERYLSGPEYTVAILGDSALPPIKLETDNLFYDYEAKYFSDDTRYICPCGLESAELASISDLAISAFAALGCAVWGRVDLMFDDKLGFVVLEVNTIPGMTTHSLVPMAAREHGYSVSELVGRILTLSASRWNDAGGEL